MGKKGKINVKAVPVHAMKTYGQVEELLHLFVTSALLGYQWSTSHLGSFVCDKGTLEPVWMFWRREKSLALAEVPNMNCPAHCLFFILTSSHKKFINVTQNPLHTADNISQIMVISGVPHCVCVWGYLLPFFLRNWPKTRRASVQQILIVLNDSG